MIGVRVRAYVYMIMYLYMFISRGVKGNPPLLQGKKQVAQVRRKLRWEQVAAEDWCPREVILVAATLPW